MGIHNEQSGKEGALLLINELLMPENQYLFDKIDFALVPQMNPDNQVNGLPGTFINCFLTEMKKK